MTALEIQLPDDFEGKYEEFRMRVLGEYHKKSANNQSSAIPKFQLDWANNKLEELHKENELTDRILAKAEDKFLPKNIKREVGEKWWKSGSVPTYQRDEYKIVLDNRECSVGSTAFNQQAICEFLFDFTKKSLGEFLMEYEISESFSTKGGKPSKRALFDAVEDLNKKIKKDLGIEGMLEYKPGPPKVKIKSSLFNS